MANSARPAASRRRVPASSTWASPGPVAKLHSGGAPGATRCKMERRRIVASSGLPTSAPHLIQCALCMCTDHVIWVATVLAGHGTPYCVLTDSVLTTESECVP